MRDAVSVNGLYHTAIQAKRKSHVSYVGKAVHLSDVAIGISLGVSRRIDIGLSNI
jgi:hypothetical protein